MTDVIRLLTRAQKLLRTTTDAAMQEHGVRIGQNLVLEVLWDTDGLTPGDLATRLDVATPTVVNTAARMEAAGLLERRRDPDDRRLVRLYLTPKARAAEAPIAEARREIAARALAAVTPAELSHLESALTKIVTALSTVES
ncbi:MarR family transcriptional regulator for hemolysin [Hamadaea flava]|uniref:MarR family winged helix-turn-helix transcriptional regulator n=1 Tax=Hamadaea flava TaxID=1742688 RepID=A0ABV8LZH5_9ACTN|nr:MarR family transcriptional regulator [Hamadaea flava]MCP2321620.1 MarR family transcriptional regulator for hemolysin [Hamadaea flava]